MPAPAFCEFVDRERSRLSERAHVRAVEQQTGTPTDDMGRYWLARTAQLEKIAAEAGRLTRNQPGLCPSLRDLLDELETIPAPVCRAGDHAGKAA